MTLNATKIYSQMKKKPDNRECFSENNARKGKFLKEYGNKKNIWNQKKRLKLLGNIMRKDVLENVTHT